MKRSTFDAQEVVTLQHAALQATQGIAADIRQLEQLLQRDVGDLAITLLRENLGRFIPPDPISLLAGAASAAVIYEREARDCLTAGELGLALVAALNGQRAVARAAGAALGLQLSVDREIDEKAARDLVSQRMNDAKHSRNRAAVDEIAGRWPALSAQGMSKSDAAKLLASEVNLSVSTVRKKLQGLPDAH